MKRDMNLIRKLLQDAEASENSLSVSGNLETYHVSLMIEAGLIDGRVSEEIGATSRCSFIHGLTWAGHDFLDASRDEGLWKKAYETIVKPTGSFSFELLLSYLKAQVLRKLPELL